jgi:hypothetical protein
MVSHISAVLGGATMSDNACIICATEVDEHPTQRNNPAPLAAYKDGFACDSCDSFVIAARMFPLGEPQSTLTFLQMAFALQRTRQVSFEMMDKAMADLEQQQTEREEAGCDDCGYIADDRSDHYPNCVHFDGCNYQPDWMEDDS